MGPGFGSLRPDSAWVVVGMTLPVVDLPTSCWRAVDKGNQAPVLSVR